MTNTALRGKPDAGNPHVRFDEGEVAPAATPRRGSLLYKIVQNGIAYRTHNEVLAAALDIHRAVKHQEVTYVLPDKWMVWFPNMARQGGDWVNHFCDGEKIIEQQYMGAGEERCQMLDYTRITFAKEREGYVFKGVYGKGWRVNTRTVRFKKLADACEIAFSGRLT